MLTVSYRHGDYRMLAASGMMELDTAFMRSDLQLTFRIDLLGSLVTDTTTHVTARLITLRSRRLLSDMLDEVLAACDSIGQALVLGVLASWYCAIISIDVCLIVRLRLTTNRIVQGTPAAPYVLHVVSTKARYRALRTGGLPRAIGLRKMPYPPLTPQLLFNIRQYVVPEKLTERYPHSAGTKRKRKSKMPLLGFETKKSENSPLWAFVAVHMGEVVSTP